MSASYQHKIIKEAFQKLIDAGLVANWEVIALDMGHTSPNWAWQVCEGSGNNYKTLFKYMREFIRYIGEKDTRLAEQIAQKIIGNDKLAIMNSADMSKEMAEKIKSAYRNHVEFAERMIDEFILTKREN